MRFEDRYPDDYDGLEPADGFMERRVVRPICGIADDVEDREVSIKIDENGKFVLTLSLIELEFRFDSIEAARKTANAMASDESLGGWE